MDRSVPLVSICVPCRNAAPYVEATLASLLAQSWRHLEVVVVDDGSTDDSVRRVEAIADPRVRLMRGRFGSAARARNVALGEARGELIKFMDADDLLSPDAVAAQVTRLEGRVDAVAMAQWGRFYNNDLTTFELEQRSASADCDPIQWLVQAWADAEPMMQAGMYLIPRPLLERCGGWDEDLSLIDDFEFFTRLLCHAHHLLYTPEAILYYRSGLAGSLSTRRGRDAAQSAFDAITTACTQLLARRSDAAARRSCANVMQNFVYSFYPQVPRLRAAMVERIRTLGGSDLPPPGGPRFQLLRRFLGWKIAARLQHYRLRFATTG